ncbi:hypothetical protein HS088_TW04G01397 [Tripterygium wilfordii]|uniref:DUF761 domain-containing protein n=1 Tax=Tripterygium wilfordii TaxID=458696 RepID=A0A7J7DST7_TRIWF|nr:uncharacterized protein LOC119997588 [Tripterygium wilfordii]KAF5749428.1 hypothetical protein HS088_TW04G01397 [Tripterygium wilfordii]
MGSDSSWSLLNRLKKVVTKVKLLLSLNYATRWRMASMVGSSSGRRRLSFNDRPGLRACADGIDLLSDDDSGSSSSCRELHRTQSYASEDDIDKRAELFIANFHRQLRIERQISLELKYLREDSSTSLSP